MSKSNKKPKKKAKLGSGSVQAHMNGRDNIHPCPRGCNSAKGATYNEKQIAWELERTALGDGFYGNALRVAKDMPGVTADDRALLDRFATGMSRATDHVDLQDLAMRIYAAAQAPPATVPAVRITPRDGKWVYGDNDEVFSSFDHETELSAVTDALDNYADAETIYVGQVKTLNVRRMIRADYLLENIGERAYDDVGEAAEHWPELSKDQQAELEGIIADYILSKSPADFYSVENVRVYTREQAEAMLAADNKENNND